LTSRRGQITAVEVGVFIYLTCWQTSRAEIEIEKILKIVPDSGFFTAYIDTALAGFIAERFKIAIDCVKLLFDSVGKLFGLQQIRPSLSSEIVKRTYRLGPELKAVPGRDPEMIWLDH
jgi:hypothetical protein